MENCQKNIYSGVPFYWSRTNIVYSLFLDCTTDRLCEYSARKGFSKISKIPKKPLRKGVFFSKATDLQSRISDISKYRLQEKCFLWIFWSNWKFVRERTIIKSFDYLNASKKISSRIFERTLEILLLWKTWKIIKQTSLIALTGFLQNNCSRQQLKPSRKACMLWKDPLMDVLLYNKPRKTKIKTSKGKIKFSKCWYRLFYYYFLLFYSYFPISKKYKRLNYLINRYGRSLQKFRRPCHQAPIRHSNQRLMSIY